MYRFSKLIPVIALLGALCLVNADRDDLPFRDDEGFFSKQRQPTFNSKLGALIIEGTFDDIVLANGLMKHFGKIEAKSPMSSKPIFSSQMMSSETLVPCQNIKALQGSDMMNNIECNPKGYTIRTTSLYKQNPLFGEKIKKTFYKYPLTTNYVRREVANLLEKNNIDDKNFIDPMYSGSTIELHNNPFGFKCLGKVLAVANNSDSYSWKDVSYSIEDFTNWLIPSENDLLFYLDFECLNSGIIGDYGVRTDILLTTRKEFPYMTAVASLKSFPYDILNVEATLKQVRNLSSPASEAYDTIISASSSSDMEKWLNFRLEKVISQDDFHNGEDITLLALPRLGLTMRTKWTPELYYKDIELDLFNGRGLRTIQLIQNIFKIAFKDSGDSDITVFTMEITKNIQLISEHLSKFYMKETPDDNTVASGREEL